MVHPRDFYIDSILSIDYFEYISYLDESVWDDFFAAGIQIIFEKQQEQTEIFIRFIQYMVERKYPEARKILGFGSYYREYSNEIYHLRFNIKYLLSGLITTSAIKTYRFYNYAIMPFDDGAFSKGTAEYYNPVALEYNKVTDMKMMDDFNEYFRNYLIGMAFRISDIYIKRMAYTIHYLQNENLFPDKCKEAMITLNKFELQLAELK